MVATYCELVVSTKKTRDKVLSLAVHRGVGKKLSIWAFSLTWISTYSSGIPGFMYYVAAHRFPAKGENYLLPPLGKLHCRAAWVSL